MEHARRDIDSPLSLDSLRVTLTDEQVREFQQLLKEERGSDTSLQEARVMAERMIRLYRLLIDPNRVEAALRRMRLERIEYSGSPELPSEPPPPSEPEPRPCRVRRDADHAKEVHFNLAMLRDELRFVRFRPTYWRWAIVALYEALGHALALHCPPKKWPTEGLGQLTRLFDVLASERPDLLRVRESVEWVDRIRTSYLRHPVTRWPLSIRRLPGVFEDCRSLIHRLESLSRQGSDS